MALTINREKTAFLSMHFQNDLVCEEGKFAAMGGPAHVKKTNCLENTRKVMEACRRLGVPVIHVQVGLTEGERRLLAETPVAPLFASVGETGALAEGTWGAEIYEEVKPQQDELIIMGKGMNSFYANPLERTLATLGIRTVVLSGFATNFVVEGTARCACDAWYEVIILRDCCASFNEEMHSFTLDNVLPNLATISDSGEFIKALG